MKILIIEDDEIKRDRLAACVLQLIAPAPVSLFTARSLHSGVQALRSEQFDLIVLDMSMPTFDIQKDEDGGRPEAYAGRDILHRMDRLKLKTPVVVVTQYDRFGEGASSLTLAQLDEQLHQLHPSTYRGSVYYDASVAGWKESLGRIIQSVKQEILNSGVKP